MVGEVWLGGGEEGSFCLHLEDVSFTSAESCLCMLLI